MTSIRLAVIGCGKHALRSHIIPGESIGFEVVAVHDNSPESIDRLRAETSFTPTVFADYKEMINLPEIDAVLIATPDGCHPQQLLDTVAAGKPVLCEKPLAISPEGLAIVDRARRLAEKTGSAVLSCHPRRETADLPYGWVKASIDEMMQRFGPLCHIELDFSYHRPEASWKRDRSLLLDHFPHEIDFLLWLLDGAPFQAQTLVDRYDSYCVTGVFSESVTFLCRGTRRLESGVFPETIRLRFDRGDCTVNTKTGLVINRDHETEQIVYASVQPTDYDARSRIIMSDFADAVQSGLDSAALAHLWRVNEASVVLAHAGRYDGR